MGMYKSAYTGPQIDSAVGKALNPDTTPTAGSINLLTSGGAAAKLAPAGYGLGENYAKWTTNANESLVSGLYSFGDACIGAPFQYGLLHVMSRGSDVKIQISYSFPDATGHTFSTERASIDGGATWGAWEWVNPPMLAGVEYRTTERYMGQPIYTQLVDMGAASDGLVVTTNVSRINRVIRYAATQGGNPLPGIFSKNLSDTWSSYALVEKASSTSFYTMLYCGASVVGSGVMCQVWYTK
jgi:hypothetical protein